MTGTLNNDIQITIDIPQKDNRTAKVFCTEFNNVQYVNEIAAIAKRVAINDTADLIFRLFAKSQNGDANLTELSKRIPCLKKEYLSEIQKFFEQNNYAQIIQEYNTTSDKTRKRALRQQIDKPLSEYVSNHINPKDMHYNFSKFKYKTNPSSIKDRFVAGADKIQVALLGLDAKDPFILAAYNIWKENLAKRTAENREAHWLLVRDSQNKIIGMTFISAKQLYDKNIDKNIIGHSGQILDPAAQGKGYVTAIKSVMTDYMYDNMDADVAKNSLFATTCDEFNENSQGLQIKSGAHVLRDKDGNIVIDNGKMHWYASKDDILNSEIMRQSGDRGVTYSISYANGKPGYMKHIGDSQHLVQINQNMQGLGNARV